MARVWKAAGKELHEDQIPFSPGTEEYKRYVASWRARAMGIDYDAPESLGAEGVTAEQKEKYKKDLQAWQQGQYDDVHADYAQSGYGAQGYVMGAHGWAYDQNANGVWDEYEAAGKYGGAGNRNPNLAADNSWNALDGLDVRTNEQKFYDRDVSDWRQVADAQGTYNWYADWSYRDKDGSTQKQEINATGLAKRTDAPEPTKSSDYFKKPTDTFSGENYWDYNGAPDENWFTEQTRNRKNLSVYARTV